jgi:RNA recognition motif-containing protein
LRGIDHAKGFANIEFEDPDDCEHAIFNMNDSELFGKVIRVTYSKPQKKINDAKSVWQTEEYQQTVAGVTLERAGFVRVSV